MKRFVNGLVVGAACWLATGAAFAQEETAKPEKHHSMAKGAAVGAAGGALYQHHRNKKSEKKAEKQQEKEQKKE